MIGPLALTTCPECGTQLAAGARFCHTCGWDSKLPAAGKGSGSARERPAWKRWVTGLSLGFLTLLMGLLLLIPRGDVSASLVPGQPAPDFDLPTLSGERIRLSDLKGNAVVVNFWASWCAPCRREMPEFQAVYDQFQEQGLVVLAVNVGDARVAVADFVESVGMRFPVLIDEKEEAQNDYKILPLPATFFIDRTGVVRSIYQFQMNRLQILSEVERILAR